MVEETGPVSCCAGMLEEQCCRGWGGGLGGPGGTLPPGPSLLQPRCGDCTQALGLAELTTVGGATGDWGAFADGETGSCSSAVLACLDAA